MAIPRYDHKLEQARKVIKALDKTNERDAAILYYIQDLQAYIDKQNDRLEEYAEFFRKLDQFLPNHNPILG